MRSPSRCWVAQDEAPLVLPAVEIVAPDGFYDFSAKYEKGKTRYLCPAPLSSAITKQIRNLALRTYRRLGVCRRSRVDFRITPRGRPYVLEINTVPGMTETSLLPMAAAQAGIDYEELTERILESAIAENEPDGGTRHENRVSQATREGDRLRSNQWKGARAVQTRDRGCKLVVQRLARWRRVLQAFRVAGCGGRRVLGRTSAGSSSSGRFCNVASRSGRYPSKGYTR